MRLADRGVDVDDQLAVAGPGAGGPRFAEQPFGEPVQLSDVAEGERSQPRADCRRRHHVMAQHALGRARPQDVGVVDAVRARDLGVDHRQQLAARPVADADQLVRELLDAQVLGQRRRQNQPRVGHRVVVVDPDLNPVQPVRRCAHPESASCLVMRLVW